MKICKRCLLTFSRKRTDSERYLNFKCYCALPYRKPLFSAQFPTITKSRKNYIVHLNGPTQDKKRFRMSIRTMHVYVRDSHVGLFVGS